ncbi:MAG: hypothetical protein QNL91_00320, partial [Candidatus Krumholzibacteria bacterium]|nr:hypothetical protein [Candidatus Krumholzibacteria bacterium]
MNPKSLPVILTMIVLLWSPSTSAQNLLFEDFSTQENMFGATAVWDTIAGQLKPNPFDIIEKGTVNTPGAARGIVVTGSKAFLADGYSGLQVIDITDPWLPTIVGTINTPGYSYEVRVAGDLAYVADHTGGLRIIDISDITNPVEIGSYVPGFTALGLAVQGHLAFVGFGTSGGVHIVDVSNPALPTLVAALTTNTGDARTVDVAGDHLYVAAGNVGMVVFDISTPTSPVEVGKVSVNGSVNAVAVQGNRLVFSADGLGLVVCDVTDPTKPVATSTIPLPGTQRHVSLDGNRAFVANDGTGIYAFDISNPYSPELLWQHDTVGYS